MLCNTYDDNNNGIIEVTEVDNCPDIGTPERNRIANRIVKFGAPQVTPPTSDRKNDEPTQHIKDAFLRLQRG